MKRNNRDDGKGDKKESKPLSGDLNVTHKRELLKQQIDVLSQETKKTIQPGMNIIAQNKKNSEILKELDQMFPKLIADTNQLSEEVKKLSMIKLPDYEERYKVADEKVTYLLIKPYFDKILRVKHKKYFFAFEKALDNTYIIDAYPHEATLFKVAVLYSLYLSDVLIRRPIEMSIFIRSDGLPDSFEYIEEQGTFRIAEWIELGQQAYDKITNGSDENLKQRFSKSCENLKKIYLGLNKPKQVNLDDISAKDIKLPELQTHLFENNNDLNETELCKPLTTTYINFTGNELATLQFLIPKHQEDRVRIPDIGGIGLATFMQACLSKQISVKESNDSELRKRTATRQFIKKNLRILNEANITIDGDEEGQMIDPHRGYVSHKANPETIVYQENKLYEEYQKELVIQQDCKLSGPELTKKFFVKAIASLEHCLANELKIFCEEYANAKAKIPATSFFDKGKLKSQRAQNLIGAKEKYRQAITGMENFKEIVEKVGAEHITLFNLSFFDGTRVIEGKKLTVYEAVVQGPGQTSYSVHESPPINDDREAAASPASSTPSITCKRC